MFVLVVSRDEESLLHYAALVRQAGAVACLAPSLEQVAAVLRATAVSGILLDQPSIMRMQGEEKRHTLDLMHLFPLLRLRWDKAAQTVQTFPPQPGLSGEEVARRFIAQRCAAFTPRRIRALERRPLHENVLLARPETSDPSQMERTVLLNFTEAGGFVFSARDWAPDDWAWLYFPHFPLGTPALCRVAHVLPWGSRRAVPGVGLEFQVEDAALRERLRELFRVPLPGRPADETL